MFVECDDMGYIIDPVEKESYKDWHKFWMDGKLAVFETKKEWYDYINQNYPGFWGDENPVQE